MKSRLLLFFTILSMVSVQKVVAVSLSKVEVVQIFEDGLNNTQDPDIHQFISFFNEKINKIELEVLSGQDLATLLLEMDSAKDIAIFRTIDYLKNRNQNKMSRMAILEECEKKINPFLPIDNGIIFLGLAGLGFVVIKLWV